MASAHLSAIQRKRATMSPRAGEREVRRALVYLYIYNISPIVVKCTMEHAARVQERRVGRRKEERDRAGLSLARACDGRGARSEST